MLPSLVFNILFIFFILHRIQAWIAKHRTTYTFMPYFQYVLTVDSWSYKDDPLCGTKRTEMILRKASHEYLWFWISLLLLYSFAIPGMKTINGIGSIIKNKRAFFSHKWPLSNLFNLIYLIRQKFNDCY